MLTDDDLRAGLRDLAAAPPAAPPERVERSVRRAARIRRARAVTSAALAVAVAVPAVAVAARVLYPPAPFATPVAAWPDPVSSGRSPLADGAYREWRDRGGTPAAGERVRFLYADQPAGSAEVAVAFALCDGGTCSRAVLMHAFVVAPRYADDTTPLAPWIVEERLLRRRDARPLTAYLVAPATAARPHPNVVFVLPPPDVTEVWWNGPRQAPDTGGAGPLRRTGAAFAGEVGYLSGPAHVTLWRGRHRVYEGTVGITHDERHLDVPFVRGVDPAYPPDGAGGGSRVQEQVQLKTDEPVRVSGSFALYLRCRGPRPVTVDPAGEARVVPCDDQVHLALEGAADVPRDVTLHPGDPYTAAAWTLVNPRRG